MKLVSSEAVRDTLVGPFARILYYSIRTSAMFKGIIATLLASTLLLACGSDGTEEPDPAAVSESAPEETDAPADSEATAEVTEEAAVPDLRKPEMFTETAPAEFIVKFETTKGDFTVVAHRNWAPIGVDRLYNMVKAGYFVETPFFRVIPGYIAQFGLHADPNVTDAWMSANLDDEPVVQGNTRGRLTFAMGSQPRSRNIQFFINMKDSSWLDQRGFGAIGEVVTGMDVVDKLYSGYGESAPKGNGPPQEQVMFEGIGFLKKEFTKLDYINKASIVD